MPRPICPLPDHLINQIAAGEVVERPASVVKELVENSLDAGARAIRVEIGGGGIDWVRVSDDGVGIVGTELPLALIRHCTSKLATSEDLAAIATLGFRGEALASIAAVARISVTSRAAGTDLAFRVTAAGSDVCGAPTPAAHPPGTTVEVAELFFNTPPRRRFLRRPKTEYLLIQQTLRQLAFMHPAVRFELRHDGRPTLTVLPTDSGQTGKARISSLLGATFAQAAIPVAATIGDLHVSGWIGQSAAARSQRDLQYIGVNGRVISDRNVSHALRLAYEDRIAPGRYPCYALMLTMAPDCVDVNVHPCKTEVRFQDPRLVHDAIYTIVRQVVATAVDCTTDSADAKTDHQTRVAERTVSYIGNTFRHRHIAPDISPCVTQLLNERWIISVRNGCLTITDGRILTMVRVRHCLAQWTAGHEHRQRPLLIPVPFTAKPELVAAAAWFVDYGFDLACVGPAQLMLRAYPAALPDFDAVYFTRELDRRYTQGTDRGALIELIAATIGATWIPPADPGALDQLLARAAEEGLLRDHNNVEIVLNEMAIESLLHGKKQ